MQTLVRFAVLCYTVFSKEVRHAAKRTDIYRQNVFNFDIDFFTKYAMIFEHSIFRQYYKCNELIYEVRKVTTYV